MPPGTETVTITIQTVDASSGAIANVETKLTGLGTVGTATSAKMATMAPALEHAGAAGATFAANAASAAAEAGTGYENLRGKMDSVRLASEEMGIRVPRAMARVIANNATLAAGLQATMGLFVAIGAVTIFEQLGEGAYHLYEKWMDVEKEVEAYSQKAAEAAEKKLFDTASLETTSALLRDIGQQIDELKQKREMVADVNRYGTQGTEDIWGVTGEVGFTPQQTASFTTANDADQAKKMGQADQLHEHRTKLQDEEAQQTLRNQATVHAAQLEGYAKNFQAQKDADALSKLHFDQQRANAAALAETINASPEAQKAGLYVTPEALKGQYDQQQKDAGATHAAQRQAADASQSRSDQQGITTAQNAATNSHLAGVALIRSQEQQAIEAAKGGIREIAAIREKYDQQVLDKIAEEQFATEKIQQTAAQAGLTGVAKIRAEGNERVTDLWANPANRAVPDEEKQKRALALEQQTDAEILDAHGKFNQEMDQLSMRADAQMEQGYARIEADAAHTRAAISKDFTEGYGQLPNNDPERIAAEQRLQAALANVDQNAQRERGAYTQKTDEEIARTEAEAARAYLPAWQAAQERIADDYTQRLAKIKADVDQHVLTEQQGARAATAAWQLANGELERQQQASRDRLAGEMSSLFDNPSKYLENRGKQIMMDMLANWMMQISEAKGPMGSALSVLFGMNPEMSTSTNPKTALGSIFAPQHHGAAGAGGTATLSAAGSTLSTAGSTLNAAGTTLSSSGTMLASAAQSLASAAMQVGSLASGGGVGAGGFGGGGLTPGGGTGDFTDMFGSGGTGAMGGGFQPSDLNAAPTGATGVMGAVPGMTSAVGGQAGGGIGAGSSLFGTLASGGVFGSGVQNFMSGGTGAAPMLNPNGVPGVPGGFQPTDLPPTNDAGVLGTPPSGDSSGSGFGLAQGMGIGMAGIGAGMTIAQNWGNPNIGSAVLNDAMAGASLGTAIMPGIGTAIGAIGGAILGLFGSLFGDHGASQMRKYNDEQIVPSITKEMTAYTAAQVGYDQGLQDMTLLQMKADAQAKQWGSGAVGVYQRKVVPEINAAITEMERQQNADRSGAITMQAAQYDSGGVIRHFGDLSTGPNSGYIHAQVGERMMDRMTNMRHSSTLDAMNRGADIPRGNGAGLGGGGNGGGESHLHLHIHALDVQDFSRFLRSGGAQEIQSHLNSNANRYAGKALGA
jgi:hypothetical protein